MKVLKANQQQYEALNGFTNGNHMLSFVQDGNGDFIVGKRVLTNPAMSEIHDQLLLLEEVDYVPVVEDE